MTKNIVWIIRVSTSLIYGGGHLRRSMILARYLGDIKRTVFVIDNSSAIYRRMLSEYGYQVIEENESEKITNAKACIMDGYQFKVADENYWRGKVKKLIRIVDEVSYRGNADVVVNYNANDVCVDNAETTSLCGLKYALVEKVCCSTYSKKRIVKSRNSNKKLLICFGMRDNKNATLKVLSMLRDYIAGYPLNLVVVLRKEAPHYFRVKKYMQLLVEGGLLLHNINSMEPLYAKADLVIGAGGVGLLERCLIGIPSLTLTTDCRQQSGSNMIANVNATINLGAIESLTKNRLNHVLKKYMNNPFLLNSLALNAKKLIDGQGPSRLGAELNKYVNQAQQ